MLDGNRRRIALERPAVVLKVATPGGSVREIEMSDADLANLVGQVASAAALRLREDR